jgi:hypothetical protein
MSEKDERDPRRLRLEGVSDLLKRAVELGVEKATEAPDSLKEFAAGMRLPKEIANVVLAQIDETKNGLFRVVAKELRDFLEQTNVSGELQSLLTTVQFEINTTIRFKPNPSGTDPASALPNAPPTASSTASPGAREPAKVSAPVVTTDVIVKRGERRERRRTKE